MGKRFRPRFENCIEDYAKHNTIHCDDRVTLCNLLNYQDEKIKKLESQVTKLKIDYRNCCKFSKLSSKERKYGNSL